MLTHSFSPFLNRNLRNLFTGLVLTLSLMHSAHAIVTPRSPGPGDSFNQGSTCTTTWAGDSGGNWGDMKIELMSGNNFQMVHVHTVGTGLDGNKDGRLDFECPEVNPNAPIYFFQYSSTSTTDLTWTTRFTIADENGNSVDPSESTQPDGASIPWGIGGLATIVDGGSITPTPPASDTTSMGTTTTTTDSNTDSATTTTTTSPTDSALSDTTDTRGTTTTTSPTRSPTGTTVGNSTGTFSTALTATSTSGSPESAGSSTTNGNKSNSNTVLGNSTGTNTSTSSGKKSKQCKRRVSKRGHGKGVRRA